PKKPFVLISVPDFSKLRESFEKSELARLWAEPGVTAFVQEVSGDSSKHLGEALRELGAETKDLKPPTGAFGVALYLRTEDPADEKSPAAREPDLFACADAGENAASWKDLIERLVDKGVKAKEFTTEEDTYAGATITILKPVYPEPQKKDEDAEDEPSAPEG